MSPFARMRRVLVIGCSGSGKSTFARRLAAVTGLPHISLDALYWQPGWTEPGRENFLARLDEAVQQSSWIIDGGYVSYDGEVRRERADTVFFFDLPRLVCMSGILWRSVSTYGRVRPEMAPGCPERFDLDFIRYVWTYREQQRPKVARFLGGLRPHQTLVRFASRREADEYLRISTPALRTAEA